MTDAQVQLIIKGASERGCELSWHEAKVIIGCKELLASEPDNELAKTVYENYARHITSGAPLTGFGEFVLPDFQTVEEIALTNYNRVRFCAFYAKLNSIGVTSHDITDSDYEAACRFQKRTGLTFDQIVAITPEELQEHR
jgi:hypothetical protein